MGPKMLKAKLGATLLIMDTGQLGNTKEAVTQVRSLLDKSEAAKNNMKRLGELADLTKQAWLKQDSLTVGKIFNEAQEILHSFNISTAKIDQLQKIALANGALGFKLSGGGLGGITITLCKNQEIANEIAAKCQDIISNSWIEEI
jgi:mevalonate kinase